MNSLLTTVLATARHQEFLDQARRSGRRGRRDAAESTTSPLRWQRVTLRLATGADAPALERLAQLDQASTPAAPVLLGVLMARPVAALSLADGCVIADPFTPTTELIELLRLRARQLRRA